MKKLALALSIAALLIALAPAPADAALSDACRLRLAELGNQSGPIPADARALCAPGREAATRSPDTPADLGFGHEASFSEYGNIVLGTPDVFNLIAPLGVGEDFVNGIEFDNSGTFTENYILTSNGVFFEVDTASGTTTPIGDATAFGAESFVCLATDPTDGTLYAGSTDCAGGSSLYTIDWESGAATRIGAVSNAACLIGCAVDASGQMYAYEIVADNFLSIDKTTGAGTVIGPLGFDANFGQGMEFDESDGTCYLFAFNYGTFYPELRTCDTATGATTYIGTLGPVDENIYQWGSGAINTGGFTGPQTSILSIPTLSTLGFALLALALAGLGIALLRRRTA